MSNYLSEADLDPESEKNKHNWLSPHFVAEEDEPVVETEAAVVGLKDPFAGMGFTYEELAERAEALARKTSRKKRQRLVCACGHSEGSHDTHMGKANEEAGRYGVGICKPGNVNCRCYTFNSVAEVTELRPFIQKTMGSGMDHALMRGMHKLVASGGSVLRWTVDQTKCQMCGAEADVERVDGAQGVRVDIYAMDKRTHRPALETTGVDVFLCYTCANGEA